MASVAFAWPDQRKNVLLRSSPERALGGAENARGISLGTSASCLLFACANRILTGVGLAMDSPQTIECPAAGTATAMNCDGILGAEELHSLTCPT
jgi:hypothetical protein